MLSYQHIYHAGNLADVHKHALLAWMLDYMTRKDKPLSYLETHAGRALYDLGSAEAVKTGEASKGIAAVRDWFDADHPYARVLDRVAGAHGPQAYPGSPRIAAELLRVQDRLHLAELHPQEAEALRAAMRSTGARVHAQDGFEMAQSLAPPDPRRGLLLIDPSYEIKSDYTRLPGIIGKLHRKWNVGVIALWYPILTDGSHGAMLRALEGQGLSGTLTHEVRFPPAREGHRMIGSGLFVVNAPFGLAAEAARLDQLFAAL
ncbi:23S rRNA (adenine(2030)-N(6))-methyltransferase RlmJ [Epibacterium sp. MM17-32]|uniref:23S rRNA (adenine(2030)-N(6))-methyltransferase RlmJ n=1 Tax=Epibacterium sp. MM17-32 TaxID=2917734 RepID=UPI001EF3FB05|nr:23S rRNA (adenine(2030)-N(6))-methyltransferase RlmJ [Epibacterium sp. MM17-32]MCG7629222.1 23S rRNA (adenine(2030)-N(6))-methyltransferase RlmJ [Epibacterium sp. MM17-32]